MKRFIGVLLLVFGGCLITFALWILPFLMVLIEGYIGTRGREAGEYLLMVLLFFVPATLFGILFIWLGLRFVRKKPHRLIA